MAAAVPVAADSPFLLASFSASDLAASSLHYSLLSPAAASLLLFYIYCGFGTCRFCLREK